MNSDEILDLVNEKDEVIGQKKRSEIYAKHLLGFRVINGFICNSEKKLWIPRRHAQKKLFPLHLDASVGGHVLTGENYEEAFSRETYEELGIKIHNTPHKKIARLTPHEHKTSAFMWIYIINSNTVPNYNTQDFTEYYWLSIDEFFERLSYGDKAKSDLIPILTHIKDIL